MFRRNRCMDYGEQMMHPNMMPDPIFMQPSMFAENNPMDAENCPQKTMDACPTQGMVCPPVYEPMVERCCHREIIHTVPHVCPVNTRIINHHIYRHTYSPCFTSCEENVCSNVYENNCCF